MAGLPTGQMLGGGKQKAGMVPLAGHGGQVGTAAPEAGIGQTMAECEAALAVPTPWLTATPAASRSAGSKGRNLIARRMA